MKKLDVVEKRETPAERKRRLKAKIDEMKKPRNGAPPPDFDDDEVTDMYDLALSELEETAEQCERSTKERVRSISQQVKAVTEDDE